MGVTLSLGTPQLALEDLHDLTRDLCNTLNRETDLKATLPEEAPRAGAKGDPITVGTIALAFITSGAAVKLFGVLTSYFERNSSMQIELERDDGKNLSIRAENVRPDRIEETIDLAREFLRGSE
jgi:hypothetical protein